MFALCVRSYFSLMKGTASPLELCLKAKELGYTHLAITDWENLYGLPAMMRACDESGMKAIIGADIGLNDGYMSCLVRTATGYSNLCSLITMKKCGAVFSVEEIPAEIKGGLTILSSSIDTLKLLHESGFTVAVNLGNKPTNKARALRHWAKEKRVPAVAAMNSSVLTDGDTAVFNLLRAINSNSTLSAIKEEEVFPLISVEVLEQRFAMWPEVISATKQLGASCLYRKPEFGIVMPPWEDDGALTPTARLREDAYKGAQNRYGADLGEVVVDRLEHELKIIDDMGFSSYFLIVRDIIHPIHLLGDDGKRHHRRICGRGSAAASLVAYCLEITNVCPVRHNLYFERFLNPGREDPPDIDIDFAWDERDEVLEEVLSKFKEHAAMVCNHVYFKPKMAIRETAKAFGLSPGEISALTKKLHWISSKCSASLEDKINKTPSCKEYSIEEEWREVLSLAEKLIGIPRYISVHPGGVVITPDRINRYVPVEMANKGIPIIQWEKDGTEELGLIKIDILGNRSLGVIRDAIENLTKNGHPFNEREWLPEEDSETQTSVAAGKTMGCFYIESPAMRLLQIKAGTGDFEQLVLQSSIIRPAANDFVREYVRRLQGGEWEHLHPALANDLDETFGLMVYQEDVSKVAVSLAGFTHARADGLRKVLSKKDRELRLKDYKTDFYKGCDKNNIPGDIIDKLWVMILSFDGYSFCKPHSASYAKVSYQAAYLKTHFPAEFMAAVISNQGGFYSTFGYVSESKRLGLKILPPDVNKSEFQWQGKDRHLLTGFLSVKNLSLETIDKIIHKRKDVVFEGINDFLYRVKPSTDEGKSLIHAGAFDRLEQGSSREQLIWMLACFKRTTAQKKNLLFMPVLPDPPKLQIHSNRDRLRYEYRSLGFLCGFHPIQFFDQHKMKTVKADQLQDYVGQHVTLVGWLLTGKIVSTKTGEAMEFLTFEDETSAFETTFFPRVYRKNAHIIEVGQGYILHGLVDSDYGAVTLTVNAIFRLFSFRPDSDESISASVSKLSL